MTLPTAQHRSGPHGRTGPARGPAGTKPTAEPSASGTPRYLGGSAHPAPAPAFLQRQPESPVAELDEEAQVTSAVQRAPDAGAAAEDEAAIQARLGVNRPGDAFEVEAERVADRVAAAPAPTPAGPAPAVQRAPAAPGPAPAAAPAPVKRTLAGAGRPMEPAVRRDMEGHFGQDLSRVRVHADADAARSAESLRAQAFTSGAHIVFGSGRYAPETRAGRHLIAHELTHVMQQQGTGARLQRKPKPKMGQMPTTTESRPATDADRREFVREAIRFLSGQADFFVSAADRPVEDALAALKTTTEGAFSTLRAMSSPGDLQRDLETAYTDAVRTVLVSRTRTLPSTTGTPPTLPELFERHREEILAFALPRHQASAHADELSAELTAPLPARPTADQRRRHAAITAARQRLRVVTSNVQMDITPLFDTRGGRMTVPVPTGTTVRFATDIAAGLHHGLRNTAAQLHGTALTANTTVMLALDLSRFGGGFESFRFTRLDLGGTLGTEILVERQGTIGVEGLHPDQRRTMTDRFTQLGFRRNGFRQSEFDQVLIGLAQIPDARLTGLSGLSFARAAASASNPDAGAEYDQSAHTITVFDRAFSTGLMRLGSGAQPLGFGSASIVHEIGHALDLAALRTTAAATEAAQAALLATFGTGGTGFRIPARGAPDRANFDRLNAAVTAAQTAENAARAISGARWSGGATSTVTDTVARGARQPAFRTAAVRDGADPASGRGFPTTYPNPDSFWQEYFAESFALYQTSPDLLQRNRPNVFAFMQGQFPP
jgi:hypothetical protein